jgi:NAD(P)-dependent dehydrogenase (short-subunit alcohol dehydrogenase family)
MDLKIKNRIAVVTGGGSGIALVVESRVKAVTPLRCPQSPEEITGMVAYLASEEARNITGQVINVDGGAVMG